MDVTDQINATDQINVMDQRLGWGILGTGKIAKRLAQALPRSRTGRLVAIGSRTQAGADRFGAAYDVPRRYDSYVALLADPQVDVVYIATPHHTHAELATQAAQAGKHILCEKPLTLNASDAAAVVDAARTHDVFLMEAFMYRCHPQTTRLLDLIRDGAIGEVRVIEATFSYNIGPSPDNYILTHEMAGGGILDVGCYPVSIARIVAGAAHGQPFLDPLRVTGCGVIGTRSRVDEYAIASLLFPGNIVAQLASGVQVDQENVVRIYGSRGSILLPNPWLPEFAGPARILITTSDPRHSEEQIIESGGDLYALEIDTVADHLAARQAPAMSWADTLGNMRTLDRWRAAIGLTYDMEQLSRSV